MSGEKVLQKANLMLSTKQKNFVIVTNFRGWAISVASYKVLAHLQKANAQFPVALTRSRNFSKALLAVAVTVAVIPIVTGAKVTVAPPVGPLPLECQLTRSSLQP